MFHVYFNRQIIHIKVREFTQHHGNHPIESQILRFTPSKKLPPHPETKSVSFLDSSVYTPVLCIIIHTYEHIIVYRLCQCRSAKPRIIKFTSFLPAAYSRQKPQNRIGMPLKKQKIRRPGFQPQPAY